MMIGLALALTVYGLQAMFGWSDDLVWRLAVGMGCAGLIGLVVMAFWRIGE